MEEQVQMNEKLRALLEKAKREKKISTPASSSAS